MDGDPLTLQTPLSGQSSPVRAVVPIGFLKKLLLESKSIMAKFGLIKSFHIDHGELDGRTAHECFVLGYELAEVDYLLKRPSRIHRPVHADNRERIIESCQDAKRPFSLTWMEGDTSESWMLLDVEPTVVGDRTQK